MMPDKNKGGRPKKAASEKRDKRLTLYLTEAESEKLDIIADTTDTDKTKIIQKAINGYVNQMENPPEALKRARAEEIMRQDTERLRGFICAEGHPFFIAWISASDPIICPVCGNKQISETWEGIIKKGY